MKKLMRILALTVLIFSASAQADEQCVIDQDYLTGGDWGHWPWGNEIRIPYSKVLGVWSTMSGDCSTYFIFKPGKPNQAGERITKITQYDPIQCQVVSQGIGFESGNVIRARMVGKTGTFDMAIHAFNESDLLRSTQQCSPGQISVRSSVIVIRMYPVGNGTKSVSYQMQKIKNSTGMWCE